VALGKELGGEQHCCRVSAAAPDREDAEGLHHGAYEPVLPEFNGQEATAGLRVVRQEAAEVNGPGGRCSRVKGCSGERTLAQPRQSVSGSTMPEAVRVSRFDRYWL
jgi:hypothetical protein